MTLQKKLASEACVIFLLFSLMSKDKILLKLSIPFEQENILNKNCHIEHNRESTICICVLFICSICSLSVKSVTKCSTRKESGLKRECNQTTKGQPSTNNQQVPEDPRQDISNGLS